MSKWKTSNGQGVTFSVSPMDESDKKTLDKGVTISIGGSDVWEAKGVDAAQAKLFRKAFGDKWITEVDKWLETYQHKVGIEKV